MAELGSRLQQAETALFVAGTLREIRAIFNEKGENFDAEDANDVLRDPPEPVHFPFLIAGISAFKDVTDALDITIAGIIVTTLLSVFVSLTLFFWFWGKMKGRWWKKAMMKFIVRRFFLMLGIELLPFLKFIPMTTIFVLMAHYKEKKIVRLMNLALEIMHKRGIARA